MGTSDKISEIQAFREKSRRSDFFNHLSAISESVPALGWVLVAPTPAPYIKEMNDAGQFYTNRVLKDWKEKAPCHSAWVKAWIASLTELQGCQMFINKESVGVEIVTAKSSEMNVMIPVGDDFVEQPVPEQFKTVINGGKLKTTATESV